MLTNKGSDQSFETIRASPLQLCSSEQTKDYHHNERCPESQEEHSIPP